MQAAQASSSGRSPDVQVLHIEYPPQTGGDYQIILKGLTVQNFLFINKLQDTHAVEVRPISPDSKRKPYYWHHFIDPGFLDGKGKVLLKLLQLYYQEDKNNSGNRITEPKKEIARLFHQLSTSYECVLIINPLDIRQDKFKEIGDEIVSVYRQQGMTVDGLSEIVVEINKLGAYVFGTGYKPISNADSCESHLRLSGPSSFVSAGCTPVKIEPGVRGRSHTIQ